MRREFDRVVVLSVDALRADHLPWQGYERSTAPFLTELADSGVVFKECYSVSSQTREVFPTLLTGEYPGEVTSSGFSLDESSFVTTVERPTGMFHSNPFVSRPFGYGDGFDKFDDDLRIGGSRLTALVRRAWDKLTNRHYARADRINGRALKWVDELETDRFLLWNHYMDVHGPYQPPDEYRELYHDDTVSNRRSQLLLQKAIRVPERLTEDERETLVDLYDAEIRYVDAQIRDLFEEFERRGLRSGTLFVITADHGEAFGERGRFEHPYELTSELLHVPLLFVADDFENHRTDVQVSLVDIVPTLLESLGRASEALSGQSLFETLESSDGSENRTVLARVTDTDSGERKYLARSETDSARARFEEGGDTPEITGTGAAAVELRSFLSSEDVEITDGVPRDDVSDEIENRLEHLGYLNED